MQSSICLLTLIAALSSALPQGSPSPGSSNNTICDKFTPITGGDYVITNNLWGPIESESPGGSQCSTITSYTADAVAWSTKFSWGGPSTKTYANAQSPNRTPCKALNTFKTIPSTWSWTRSADYTGNVAYDAFLASNCPVGGAGAKFEVMLWLAQLGGQVPIGDVKSSATIGGSLWYLYAGENTSTGSTVYSFVAAAQILDFSADLMLFMNYLVQNYGVDATLNLTPFQAGNEVSQGSATVTTSEFSISST